MKRSLVLIILVSSLLNTAAFASGSANVKELVKPSLDSGPANSEGSGVAVSDSSVNKVDKIVKIPTTLDDQKTERILNNLAAQSGWFPQLKISVAAGMVTIDGHVKDAEQLAWLAKTADRLPTVIAVINKANVDEPAVTDLTPAWKEFLLLLNQAKRALPLLLLAAVLISIFVFISKFIYGGVHSVWRRHINNPFLLSTVTKISMVPIWLVLFYLVLQTAGLSSLATTIIGGTGVVGIVIGFAFKDIAENYLSGLLLAIRSPFTKGDDVTVAGYDGYVQALNMRGTTILAYDGTLILVPNSIVIQSVIKNRSTNPRTRLSFTIGIGYDDSASRAIDLIYGALLEIPAVLEDPAALVIATDLSASSVTIQVRFWIDASKDSSDKTKSAAISRAKEVLLANGISLPDPSREVIFTDPLKIQNLGSSEDARASERQRIETVKEKATANLSHSKSNQVDTTSAHDDQVKKLGDGVDIMNSGADKALVKSASV
jgi:small conductance mechanosensitive channel